MLVLSSSTPNFPTTALRTHAVFRAQDTNLLPLMLGAPRNLHLGPGTNLYDFTYAPNLAHAHVLAAINLLTIETSLANPVSAAGKPFFVTNAEPLPFQVFLKMVWEAFDGEESPKGTSVPVGVAKVMVRLGQKVARVMGKTPVLTVQGLGDSLAERWFDCSRARDVLGYVLQVKIADALKEAAEVRKEGGKRGMVWDVGDR